VIDRLLGAERKQYQDNHTADNNRGDHTTGDGSSLGGGAKTSLGSAVCTVVTLHANALSNVGA